jgi:hypothetical protein
MYNEHIMKCFLEWNNRKFIGFFCISIANYIDVSIYEGGTSNGDDGVESGDSGVGYEVSHNKLVDKEFKEDGKELLGVEA